MSAKREPRPSVRLPHLPFSSSHVSSVEAPAFCGVCSGFACVRVCVGGRVLLLEEPWLLVV